MARKTMLRVKLWKRARGKSVEATSAAKLLGLFVPKGIAAASGRFLRFSSTHHSKMLGLNEEFVNSLTPETKIIELGAGTGRLAEHLLKRSRIKPENYTLFDLLYNTRGVPLRRQIYQLVQQGRLRIVGGNYYSHDFGNEQWDHILMPGGLIARNFAEIIGAREVDRDFTFAIKKLLRHVKVGGTLRASHLLSHPHDSDNYPKLREMLEAERQRGNINIRLARAGPKGEERYGLIITKLRKPHERE